jgi:hypothetical protein
MYFYLEKLIMFKDKYYIWELISLISILFLIWYFYISSHIRIDNSDDFLLIQNLSNEGFFDSIVHWNFNKRFTSFLIFNLFYTCFAFTNNIHFIQSIFVTFQIILLVLSSFLLIKKMQDNYFKNVFTSQKILLISLVFIISLFFFSAQNNEIWFWMSASVVHLFPISLILLSLNLFLSSKKWKHILAYFLIFLIGGSSELIAISISLGAILLFFFSGKYKSRYFSISVLVLIPFLWSILSSGVTERIMLEKITHQQYHQEFFVFLKDLFIAKKNLFFLLLLPFFAICGQYVKNRPTIIRFQFTLRKLIAIYLVFDIVLFLINYFVLHQVFNSYGPLRAWSFLSIIIMGQMIYISFRVGYTNRIQFSSTASLTSLFFVILFVFYAKNQLFHSREFSKAYDERIDLIINNINNEKTDPICFKKLPDPGVLISSDDLSNLKNYYSVEEELVFCEEE